MTLNELLVEQRIEQLRQLSDARSSLEEDVRAEHRGPSPRAAIASALIWLAVRLDRRAGERALSGKRQASY